MLNDVLGAGEESLVCKLLPRNHKDLGPILTTHIKKMAGYWTCVIPLLREENRSSLQNAGWLASLNWQAPSSAGNHVSKNRGHLRTTPESDPWPLHTHIHPTYMNMHIYAHSQQNTEQAIR